MIYIRGVRKAYEVDEISNIEKVRLEQKVNNLSKFKPIFS